MLFENWVVVKFQWNCACCFWWSKRQKCPTWLCICMASHFCIICCLKLVKFHCPTQQVCQLSLELGIFCLHIRRCFRNAVQEKDISKLGLSTFLFSGSFSPSLSSSPCFLPHFYPCLFSRFLHTIEGWAHTSMWDYIPFEEAVFLFSGWWGFEF